MSAERMKIPPKEEKNKANNSHSQAEDIFASIMITYALMSYGYEKYMPQGFMEIFNGMVFIVFLAVWVGFSFRNGYRKKIAFPIFTVLFFMLPHLVVFLSESGPRVFRMSIIMYVLSGFCEALSSSVSAALSGLISLSPMSATIGCLIIFLLAYAFGTVVVSNKPKNGNYTPKRC